MRPSRRRSGSVLVLALVLLGSAAAPARARSTGWDANDVPGPMDLRWASVVRVDDTVRVTIVLWDPARTWMLRAPWLGTRHALFVMSRGWWMAGRYGEGYVHVSPRTGKWVTTWYDGGSSGIVAHYRASHPDPYTFKLFFPAKDFTGIVVAGCDKEHREDAIVATDLIPADGSRLQPR